MTKTLFDRYVAVDWSAANRPKTGSDSIWIATGSQTQLLPPLNLSTRAEAVSFVRRHIQDTLEGGKSAVYGFDFAFGYPLGTAERLGVTGWSGLWALLYEIVRDDPENRSNRFEVAETLNRRIGEKDGPFWGHPWQHEYQSLSPKKPKGLFPTFPEWRYVDRAAKGAKSVWQLCYNGAVGSQTLLGIAALEGLRRDSEIGPYISIWPFETSFANHIAKPIIFAEIYPTSHIGFPSQPYPIKDARQVAQIVEDFKAWDEQGCLSEKFTAELPDAIRHAVLQEEGWTVAQKLR